jgi:molybdenum cofactor cytidylyltransferase
MQLRNLFNISSQNIIAFVGGGGKTSAMFRLASEIVADGGQVVTTTTTRIFAAQTRLAPVHVQSVPDLLTACQHHPHVLLTGEVQTEGKAFGIEAATVCELKDSLPNHNILIEADGSRMRPFKAPAEHEPVIPACTTLVIPVVGIDALGKPLDAEHIHRPEQVRAIYDGDIVTPEMIAAVLVSTQGGRKSVPAGARVIGLINKVETADQMVAAREIARLVQAAGVFDGMVIGAVSKPQQTIIKAWGK